MIIGLTGKNAAGKGEVAEYLTSKGFSYHSLSDVIRAEASERGMEHSRENLIKLGNELRKRHGPGVLAKRIAKKVSDMDVVDSIRNPSEIAELRKLRDFTLIGVDAPVELRFERARARGRMENAVSLEEFKAIEEKENSSDEKSQQLDKCLEQADHILDNMGTLEHLYKNVDELLSTLETQKT